MTEKAQQNTSQKAQHNDDVVFELDKRGIATLTLNRPQKRNAFNAECIGLLREHLAQLSNTPDIRGLVLKANGEFFSAGADLAWMQAMVNKSMDENIADAEQLAGLLRDLDTFPHPTIAIVQGSAFGGALGLICCCDIVIAQNGCEFSFSEVKLGLVPATIAPYVVRAIGQRQARRFMLTAEKFDSTTAQQLGMVHVVTQDSVGLHEQHQRYIGLLLSNAPTAIAITKQLCKDCDPLPERLYRYTSELIARVRTSPEGQEGLKAFLNKQKPSWIDHG